MDDAAKAGRKYLHDYSPFYNSMVPDDAMRAFVEAVVHAYLNSKEKQ